MDITCRRRGEQPLRPDIFRDTVVWIVRAAGASGDFREDVPCPVPSFVFGIRQDRTRREAERNRLCARRCADARHEIGGARQRLTPQHEDIESR